MAIDFDALDLVRGENKARSYNKKLDGLQQQVILFRSRFSFSFLDKPRSRSLATGEPLADSASGDVQLRRTLWLTGIP